MSVPRVLVLVLLLLVPSPAAADMILPAGFTARVYVTGEGFDPAEGRGGRGIPSASTLAVDDAGILYLARTGRRYSGGEADDLWPIYRIPVGGARLTKRTESRFLYGPPLPSAQVAAVRGGRELFVTTFDRDRQVGVLYAVVGGRAELVAGGTPPRGTPPMLTQPEGAAVDPGGNLYVADRARDRVVKLGPGGAMIDARYLSVKRPRVLAVAADGALWVAADGGADAPWQRGPGEIWRVAPDGSASVVLHGPVAAGMAAGPGGYLFVADRQGSQLFALGSDGRRVDVVRFTDGDAPRGLAFAPVTPQTERAGIAGDLFVVTITRGAFPVNEVTRISGPFERFLGSAPAAAPATSEK